MPSAADIAKKMPGYFTVEGFGDPVIVTISACDTKKIKASDTEESQVLSFLESPKQLPLNKTRVKQLVGIFGDKEVVGEKVKLEVRKEGQYTTICIDPV